MKDLHRPLETFLPPLKKKVTTVHINYILFINHVYSMYTSEEKNCLKILKHLVHLKAQNTVNQGKYGLRHSGRILVKHESTEQENWKSVCLVSLNKILSS